MTLFAWIVIIAGFLIASGIGVAHLQALIAGEAADGADDADDGNDDGDGGWWS